MVFSAGAREVMDQNVSYNSLQDWRSCWTGHSQVRRKAEMLLIG
jgi:hypothetical protein